MDLKNRIACLLILAFSFVNAQDHDGLNVFETFTQYTNTPRELAYGHLNKSIYINGETLAFTVYVFDKNSKEFSAQTRNMYVTIADEQGQIVKSKLLMVVNGVCNGSFFIDQALTSGNYTFKAFTNYMKNFDEQNYYVQNFRVLISGDKESEEGTENPNVDAQFLPEGGHLVEGVLNTIGVIIKNEAGLGLGMMEGTITDQRGQFITNFKTDEMGIGRFAFTPMGSDAYNASFKIKEQEYTYKLPATHSTGIALSLVSLPQRVALQFRTNTGTLKNINDRPYTLTIHNGKTLNTIAMAFEGSPEVIKFINKEDLFSGINVFTLFDSDNKPVLERLYFNHKGIDLMKSDGHVSTIAEDSISLTLKYQKPNTLKLQNLSISILPVETESYLPSHNIISYVFLQPYVKGYIENAAYYFTEVTPKKELQLDNLLITQGWSSFNWNSLFTVPAYSYRFENGIDITANLTSDDESQYTISSNLANIDIITIEEDQSVLSSLAHVPFGDDLLFVSAIRKNGKLKRPSLYIQFSPSKIPDFDNYVKMLPRQKPSVYKDVFYQDVLQTSWTGVEQLDEIILNVSKKETEIEQIKSREFGNVEDWNDQNRYAYRNFATYLRSKGYGVDTQDGNYVITSPGNASSRNIAPAVFLDGVRLLDVSILAQLDMGIIDYTIINKNATGGFATGNVGTIKIFTDPSKPRSNLGYETTLKLDFPLTFSEGKRFYAPKYSFYKSTFFKKYGVIEWIPRAQLNEDGEISFKFLNNDYLDYRVFVEGSVDGKFISESITVTVEE